MPTQSEEELRRIKKRARALLGAAGGPSPKRRPPDPAAEPAPTPSTWDNLDAILAPIQWDWPGWLPRGFLTILVSEPGAGKSLLCLHLAATYLRGTPWPDGAPFVSSATGAAVVWCESEASHALNLQRARRWGLDLSRILSPLTSPLHNFNPGHDDHATALLTLARRDDVRLIILDSLRGLTAGSNALSLGDLLRLLADVARIANIPVLLTHHLRKRVTYDHAGALTLDQILGASTITQVPRVIWAVDRPDLHHPDHRRLSIVKNNLTLRPDPLGFHVRENNLHFGPAPEPPTTHSERDRAIAFLRQHLAAGSLPAKKIEALYRDAGLARRTVFRAKRRLGVRSFRPPGETEWHWELPRKK